MTSRRFLPATEFLRCPFGLDSGLLRGAGHISIDDRFGPSSIARGEFRTGERRATCRRMRVVRDWTREQLDPEDVDFMGTFEPRIEIGFAGAQLVCFYGSPNSYDDILLPDYEGSSLVAFMGEESADLLAGGHTHRQWTRRIGKSLFVNPAASGSSMTCASPAKRSAAGAARICPRWPSTRSSSLTRPALGSSFGRSPTQLNGWRTSRGEAPDPTLPSGFGSGRQADQHGALGTRVISSQRVGGS